VNLVAPEAVGHFKDQVSGRYFEATGHRPEIYVCEPADGVGPVGG
jgi:galactokinase